MHAFQRLVVCALLALVCCRVTAQAQVPLDVFAANELPAPKLSPSGRYIASPARHTDGSIIVFVTDLDGPAGEKPKIIRVPDLLDCNWIEWANDDRLMFSLTRPAESRMSRYSFEATRIIATDRDGGRPVTLGQRSRHMTWNLNTSDIVDPLPSEPEFVLLSAGDGQGHLNLLRVNVTTGKAELAFKGTSKTVQWQTDLTGAPRVRLEFDDRNDLYELHVRKAATDTWVLAGKFGDAEGPDFSILGFTDDPRIAIAVARRGADKYAVVEYDTETGAFGKTILQNASYDLVYPAGDILVDPQSHKIVGISEIENAPRMRYFDQLLTAIHAKVQGSVPASTEASLTSWSADKMRVIFSIAGPKDPGSHYFIDLKAGTIELASRSQPAIAAGELGDMRTVQYAAQDGTRLTGYLTLPPGRGPKNLPLVVMPHGGPESRDWISFHGWAQVLANRGYAVFQPNFRGSGGFGRAFAEAGHRQWGRLMQSDVSDGVSALIKDGTADAGRICIVGASYGGYAALAGGALTPQVYKCVVSIAGVSDLVEMVDAVRRETGSDSLTYKYWVKRVGDPSTDSAQMRSVSPSEHAADFRAPVLLVHGKDDGIVPLKQSLTMERALKSAGKSVKLVEIPLEGHHFARASSRLTLFKELEQFLYANIGN